MFILFGFHNFGTADCQEIAINVFMLYYHDTSGMTSNNYMLSKSAWLKRLSLQLVKVVSFELNEFMVVMHIHVSSNIHLNVLCKVL